MSIRHLRISRSRCNFIVCWILFSWLPGCILSAVVTLESVTVFTTHDWFTSKPTVYFKCKGENETVLPDVKKANVLYTFKGEESWQPLTELERTKCKRCGFYEQENIKSDDTFDEWEFCPSEFIADGRYVHFQEKEINATFLCQECVPPSPVIKADPPPEDKGKEKEKGKGIEIGMHTGFVIIMSTVVSVVVVIGAIGIFKYCQRRKRQQDQARFMKLFEDGDDIEDELGSLGNEL